MLDRRVCAGPAALLLLLAVTLAGPRPAASAVFFFSRDEVTPAPPPTPTTAPCVCSLADWCRPLFKPKTEVNEVFAFVLNTTQSTWLTFDWKKLTTIVLFDFIDAELVCHAHQNNVRVLHNANFLKANVTNATYRAQWVAEHVNYTRFHYLDGINVDFEDPMDAKEPARQAFVQLMNDTRKALQDYNVMTVLSVDVPWSPDCIDGRCYDFVGLQRHADMFFVMGYDLRSQVHSDDCIAGANAPLNQTLAGVRKYLQLNITANKLVLGVPWYGYDYPCLNVTNNGTRCSIERVPFRKVSCSDAAGTERPFSRLAVWSKYALERFWSNASQSPYFNVKFENWNMTHQVWFDNSTSLTYKYMGAASLKLRGVGMWAANFLAAGDSAEDRAQRDEMWGALPSWDWQSSERHRGGSAAGSPQRLEYREKKTDLHRNVELRLLNNVATNRLGKSPGKTDWKGPMIKVK
ncbi:di-N-acetylchitobiase-like isoform X2 [Amphibalanus amphitrite]|nr:di-N-acetylchitobiase-like isoform X2 [Amphibalanus amphitrite]XP_043226761.1 di-N-acetylchitobiase-like isoform X2 [Amphibalanus amphitrite]XP_043226762.1 di-N-acetylchitobiase-like isoform X2 [Amphibalanus amphitrite]